MTAPDIKDPSMPCCEKGASGSGEYKPGSSMIGRLMEPTRWFGSPSPRRPLAKIYEASLYQELFAYYGFPWQLKGISFP
jgi:hypothetical protein